MGSVVAALWAAVRASRYLQLGLAVLAGLGGLKGWMHIHDAKVKREIAAQIGHANTKLAAKGGEARKVAAAPGSSERVRLRYCADCGGGK